MRILFLGTGEIGVPTLRWLVRNPEHRIVGVVCQPDKPAGRNRELTAPATKAVAVEYGLPVWQPERIQEAVAALVALDPEVMVVMAYGQFLPRSLREGASRACLNLHASLLPRWRGASPVQSAIAAGDTTTGITVMHVEQEMDAGDTVLAEATPILPTDTGRSLHDRLADLAPQALARALPLIEAGAAPRRPQDPALVTRCARLTRAHGRIDWTRPAVEIERLVRAFEPWPGTHTSVPDGRALKIYPPVVVGPPVDTEAGTLVQVAQNALIVAAGGGSIELDELQLGGQRRLPRREFVAGCRLARGQRLGAAPERTLGQRS